VRIERIELGDFDLYDKNKLEYFMHESVNLIQEIIERSDLKDFSIHSSYWQSGLVALHLSKKFNIEFVHTVLSSAKAKNLSTEADRAEHNSRILSEYKVFHAAKNLICSSHTEKKTLAANYGISCKKILVAGPVVNKVYEFPFQDLDGNPMISSKSKTKGSCQNEYLPFEAVMNDKPALWWNAGAFLYFGRLHEDKGVLDILRAWLNLRKLLQKGVPPLWMVGGTPSQIDHIRRADDSLMRDIQQMEAAGELIWWGRLSQEGISTLLCKALATVTHSKYEAGGFTVIESLARGIPVLATPHGFALDCIVDWENGFLIEHGNLELLEHRMLHFARQPLLSKEMGQIARAKYFEQKILYDFDKVHSRAYDLEKPDQKTQGNFSKPSRIYSSFHSDVNKESVIQLFQQVVSCSEAFNLQLQQERDYSQWTISSKAGECICRIWNTTINSDLLWSNKGNLPYIKSARMKEMSDKYISDFLEISMGSNCEQAILLKRRPQQECEIGTLQKNIKLLNKLFSSKLLTNYEIFRLAERNSIPRLRIMADQAISNLNAHKHLLADERAVLALMRYLSYSRNFDRGEMINKTVGLSLGEISEHNFQDGSLYHFDSLALSSHECSIGSLASFLLLNKSISSNEIISCLKGNFASIERRSMAGWTIYWLSHALLRRLLKFPQSKIETYDHAVQLVINLE